MILSLFHKNLQTQGISESPGANNSLTWDLRVPLVALGPREGGISVIREIRGCASEVASYVGESPTGRVKRFTTETRCPGRGREAEPQAGRRKGTVGL
jgi:hypothetical protein